MFELLQKMLGILQKQIVVIIEGGITVVGQEVDGIQAYPRRICKMQTMNSSVTGTSLARFKVCHQLYLHVVNTGYSHEIYDINIP